MTYSINPSLHMTHSGDVKINYNFRIVFLYPTILSLWLGTPVQYLEP